MPWMDPIPAVDHQLLTRGEANTIKRRIMNSGLSVSELVQTARASTASFRDDMRGGANGARVRLEPARNWQVNNPVELERVISKLDEVRKVYNRAIPVERVSLADTIVLGGAAAVEKRREMLDQEFVFHLFWTNGCFTSANRCKVYSVLEPKADGFRNYYSDGSYMSPLNMLIDKANMLSLTVLR